MVASRQLEVTFYRSNGQERGRGLGALAQIFGRTAITLLRKKCVPAAKPLGAEFFRFAAPEVTHVSDRKIFKTAAKSVGRYTLRKQSGSGSRRRTASRVIPTKSAEKNQAVATGHFSNTSQYSCRSIFGTNFLWQLLETLEGKSY